CENEYALANGMREPGSYPRFVMVPGVASCIPYVMQRGENRCHVESTHRPLRRRHPKHLCTHWTSSEGSGRSRLSPIFSAVPAASESSRPHSTGSVQRC